MSGTFEAKLKFTATEIESRPVGNLDRTSFGFRGTLCWDGIELKETTGKLVSMARLGALQS